MNNTKVATTHAKYTKFRGYLIAKVGPLAVIINTIVVPAGLVTLGWSMGIPTIAVLLVVGILLALVSDGMTLSACSRMRHLNEQRAEMKERLDRVPENEKTTQSKEIEEAKLRKLHPSYTFNGLCIVFFGLVSASAGDIFWHQMLISLVSWMSISFSILFSLLITGTMIACELFVRENTRVIEEGIRASNLVGIAVVADAKEAASLKLAEQYSRSINDLSDHTDAIKISVQDFAIDMYGELLGNDDLPLRIRQEKSAKQLAIEAENNKTRRQQEQITGASQVKSSAKDRVWEYLGDHPTARNYEVESALPDIPAKSIRVYAAQFRAQN